MQATYLLEKKPEARTNYKLPNKRKTDVFVYDVVVCST